MAIAFIDYCDGGGNGSTATTSAMDSTGADLLIVSVETYSTTVPKSGLSDNKSNTFIELAHISNGVSDQRVFICRNPSVGTGHTFTYSLGSSYPAISAAAFSGVGILVGSEYTTATASTITSGSLSTTSNGSLFFFSVGSQTGVTQSSVSSGFTELSDVAGVPAVNTGIHTSYKIQSTAGSESPTSTMSGSSDLNSAFLVFEPAPSGGGGGAVLHPLRSN
jgi:hypothetical protein